ncbi:hypothetical protein SK128_004566 [Halocaridina rubra]|uniref:Alanine racemase N-terminal domain-containing protein n=1 Tax=Halocaridina rubra TaxID=373956 RepID=A0AAN8WZ31_HALRR
MKNCILWKKKILLHRQDGSRLQVAINLDTGMSRYGVQPEDLPSLIQTLDELQIPIASFYTHFQSAITEKAKNQRQLDMFIEAIGPYKYSSMPFISRKLANTTELSTQQHYPLTAINQFAYFK